jgi:hypothetical protein
MVLSRPGAFFGSWNEHRRYFNLGALLSYKHFERHRRHLRATEAFREVLGIESKNISAREIERAAVSNHKQKFNGRYLFGDQIEQI